MLQGPDILSLQAFVARRVITPDGIRPAAILVKGEQIQAIVSPDQVPAEDYKIHDFGEAAILPGLVDSHLHINDPGRAEWEGFETATRAAAAGGYTLLVDMPLNCLPATTTVAALEAKREAAQLSQITSATLSRWQTRECRGSSVFSFIPALMASP